MPGAAQIGKLSAVASCYSCFQCATSAMEEVRSKRWVQVSETEWRRRIDGARIVRSEDGAWIAGAERFTSSQAAREASDAGKVAGVNQVD